jgi:hypothetical protein
LASGLDALFGLVVDTMALGVIVDTSFDGDLQGSLEEDMVDLLDGPSFVTL